MRELKRPLRFYRFDMMDFIIQMLNEGKSVQSNVRGNSMEPTAYDGDKIMIQPINNYDDLKVGQIVAIVSEDHRHFVVHRIKEIEATSRTIYEQGDNRETGSYVNFERIKGIVTEIIK